MTRLKTTLIAFLRDDSGLTTVEYAVAGGLIAAVVVGAFQLLGGSVGAIITGINNLLAPAVAAAGG